MQLYSRYIVHRYLKILKTKSQLKLVTLNMQAARCTRRTFKSSENSIDETSQSTTTTTVTTITTTRKDCKNLGVYNLRTGQCVCREFTFGDLCEMSKNKLEKN